MAFNHYAKIKRILHNEQPDWHIIRIHKPTTALNFKGEKISYDYYYRIYRADGSPIKYCKFQKLDKLASTLNVSVDALPVSDS